MLGGTQMSVDEIMAVVRDNDFNVTFSGGDPLYQPVDALTELARQIRAEGYTLWCYTGFVYEQLCDRADLQPLLSLVNVLVDGPFVASLRDSSLRFRGSSNQRLLALNH